MSRYIIVNILFLALFIGSLVVDGTVDISVHWYIWLTIIYLAVTFYGSMVLSARFFLPVRCKAARPGEAISITFDDGPLPGMTEKILDILKQNKIQGAFFCIGDRVKQYPELLKQIHEEGHLVGNHSFSHSRFFDFFPSQKVGKELKNTNEAIRNCIGVSPKFFRPPYGITNPMIAKAVKKLNFTVIGWSVRSFDTIISDRKKLFNRVTRRLKAGDIVLFHDYCRSTVEMLPEFLEHVSKRGLKIVRVDELLNEKAYV